MYSVAIVEDNAKSAEAFNTLCKAVSRAEYKE